MYLIKRFALLCMASTVFLGFAGITYADEKEPTEAELRAVVTASIPAEAGITVVDFKKAACQDKGEGKVSCLFSITGERINPQTGMSEKNTAYEAGIFWKEGGRWVGHPEADVDKPQTDGTDDAGGTSGTNRTPPALQQTFPTQQSTFKEPTEAEMRVAIEASKPSGVSLKIVGFRKDECKGGKNGMFLCSFSADIEGANPKTNVIERWTYDQIGIFQYKDGKWTSSPPQP